MRTCPFCAEEIQDEAIKCKHCGEWFTDPRPGDGSPSVGSPDIATESEEDYLYDWKVAPPDVYGVEVRFLGEDCFIGASEKGYYGVWLRGQRRPLEKFPGTEEGWDEAWERFSELSDRYASPDYLDEIELPAHVESTETGRATSRPPWGWVAAVILVVALGAIAYGFLRGNVTGGQTLSGTLTLRSGSGAFGNNFTTSFGGCRGKGGYSDIAPGVSVVVYDETGDALGTVPLGEGTPNFGACEFSFRFTDLPDAETYSIEVSHRGKVTYTKSDLDANGWDVALRL